MLEYVADNLIADALERARLPDRAFDTSRLLSVARREMESYLAPFIVAAQEDYYEWQDDRPLLPSPAATYRVPTRAIGGALREVSFLDASGNVIDVPRISLGDLARASWGFTVKSQSVTYVNKAGESTPVTLRMIYALQPNLLAQAAAAAKVTAIAGRVLTIASIDTPPFPLDLPDAGPAPTSWTGQTVFDLVSGTPGFEVLGFDLAGTISGVGTTLTLAADPPADLAVGDYVSLPHETPIPQAPVALFPLFAQRIAVTLLKRAGQMESAKAEMEELKLMEVDARSSITNRVKGAPISLIPRRGFFQAVKRW